MLDVTLEIVLWHVAVVIGFLLAALAVVQVLRQRRSPAGTMAWLLILILAPYVGVPLYILLGGRKMRRQAGKKHEIHLPDYATWPPDEAAPLDRILRSYGIPGAARGNRLKICPTGEATYAELLHLIDSAEESLFAATYILADDEVGREILNRLTAAAGRGVKVRLLLDGFGNFGLSKKLLEPLEKAGGRTGFFMPVIHTLFRGRMNLRNHRKMVVADQKIVLAGGNNLALEYIGPKPLPERWLDLSFRLEGPAVAAYTNIFISDWEFVSGETLPFNPKNLGGADNGGPAVVQVVPSGPDVRGEPLHDAIIQAAFEAEKRMWIVTPYFVPDETLTQALTIAAHRGVDLRVYVPARSNHRLADWARSVALRQVQSSGGRVFYYQGGMMHAKLILIDDRLALCGSANMDMRSLFLNYEAVVVVYSWSEIKNLEEWISQMARNSAPAQVKSGTLREIGDGFIRILAPLL